jgi:hypothetical protein
MVRLIVQCTFVLSLLLPTLLVHSHELEQWLEFNDLLECLRGEDTIEELQSDAGDKRCPSSNPWAYYNGEHCCKYNKEKVYAPQGTRCDGSVIALDSLCCLQDAHIPCPHGRCTNYSPSQGIKMVQINKGTCILMASEEKCKDSSLYPNKNFKFMGVVDIYYRPRGCFHKNKKVYFNKYSGQGTPVKHIRLRLWPLALVWLVWLP